MRKIIHVDMDAFFASVEQKDHPELKGKAIAVGGSAARGVVAAASYEARKFGVKSAMPSITAKKLCPELIFVKPRFDRYKEISDQIRGIFNEYTHLVEPLSLDEAYLDVTNNLVNNPSATLIAEEIRFKIKNQLNLNASAGVSYNKFLAKIASDVNKPNGIFVIEPHQAQSFIEKLPIHKFYGIGKVTAKKMQKIGIHYGADLQKLSEIELINKFGKAGKYYFNVVRGIDERTVNPNRIRKSIGAERTFEKNLSESTDIYKELKRICEILIQRINANNVEFKTINLKIKYADFTVASRALTLNNYTKNTENLFIQTKNLYSNANLNHKPIRLIGVSVSNLKQKGQKIEQLQFDFM